MYIHVETHNYYDMSEQNTKTLVRRPKPCIVNLNLDGNNVGILTSIA